MMPPPTMTRSTVSRLGELAISVSVPGLRVALCRAIPIYLILPMAMMGIAFSLVPAVMWPSVAIIVDQSKLGTACGLMTMIQNIGLFSFNLLIGFANDFSGASAENPAGYNLGMWIFSILGFLGLLFAYLLRKSETGPKGHGLELGMKQKKS